MHPNNIFIAFWKKSEPWNPAVAWNVPPMSVAGSQRSMNMALALNTKYSINWNTVRPRPTWWVATPLLRLFSPPETCPFTFPCNWTPTTPLLTGFFFFLFYSSPQHFHVNKLCNKYHPSFKTIFWLKLCAVLIITHKYASLSHEMDAVHTVFATSASLRSTRFELCMHWIPLVRI